MTQLVKIFIPITFVVILGLAILNEVHTHIMLKIKGDPNSDCISIALDYQAYFYRSFYVTVPFGIIFIFSNKICFGSLRRAYVLYVIILFIFLSYGCGGLFRSIFWMFATHKYKKYDIDLYNVKRFNRGENISLHFKQTQKDHKCCGIVDVNDWNTLDSNDGFIPDSCCVQESPLCGIGILKSFNWSHRVANKSSKDEGYFPKTDAIYKKGCLEYIYPYTRKIAIHSIIYFVLLIPAILFMIIGFIVSVSIRNVKPVDNTMLQWELRFNETEKNLMETNLILMENILHPIYADKKEHKFLLK